MWRSRTTASGPDPRRVRALAATFRYGLVLGWMLRDIGFGTGPARNHALSTSLSGQHELSVVRPRVQGRPLEQSPTPRVQVEL